MPWLPWLPGFILTALLLTVTVSSVFAAVTAAAASAVTGVSFPLAFGIGFAIAVAWWLRRWFLFWRLVKYHRPRPWGQLPGDHGVREPRSPGGPRPSLSAKVDPPNRGRRLP